MRLDSSRAASAAACATPSTWSGGSSDAGEPGTTSAERPWRIRRSTALPAGTLGPGLVRLVHAAGGQQLVGVGSITGDGDPVPAIWRTSDGTSWQRLDAAPRSITGVRSELTAVTVASDGRAAAVGQ